MAYTVAQIIAIAKVSQYLAQNDVAKGRLFGPRKIPLSPKILYAERKAVEWLYGLDPTNSTLTLTANYLYSLCRGYNLKAANIVNGGSGGGVSPVSPSSAPSRLDFLVSTSSFLPTGTTSFTFPATWKGFNLAFNRDNLPQSQVQSETTSFLWDRTTAQFSCSPALIAGELIALIPT